MRKQTIVEVSGVIAPATLGWTADGKPVQHKLIGGKLTPACTKNGVAMKSRVTFELIINDGADTVNAMTFTAFSAIDAAPGKGQAEMLARMLVPGRTVHLKAIYSIGKVPVNNNDGSPVLHNGKQYISKKPSYVVNAGDVEILTKDSLRTQELMAIQWGKVMNLPNNANDFFWRPCPFKTNDLGVIESRINANVAEHLGKCDNWRNAMVPCQGMRTYGYCVINIPEGAIVNLPANPDYMAWLQSWIQYGIYDVNGLPIITPAHEAMPVSGAMPVMGGQAQVSTGAGQVSVDKMLQNAQGNPAVMAAIQSLMSGLTPTAIPVATATMPAMTGTGATAMPAFGGNAAPAGTTAPAFSLFSK